MCKTCSFHSLNGVFWCVFLQKKPDCKTNNLRLRDVLFFCKKPGFCSHGRVHSHAQRFGFVFFHGFLSVLSWGLLHTRLVCFGVNISVRDSVASGAKKKTRKKLIFLLDLSPIRGYLIIIRFCKLFDYSLSGKLGKEVWL